MKHLTSKLIAAAIMGSCLLATSSSWAADVYLRADEFNKPLPGHAPVQMWGFALDNATWTAGTLPTSPGPRIDVAPSDTTLKIHLRNNLDVPVSIVIPNQNGYVRTADDAKANHTINGNRARSFVKETGPGETVTYEWNNLTPGTYLYHSGSHPSLQVQMGLYGATVRKPSPTDTYPAAQNDALVLFSEIDTKVHEAVAADDYGPGGTLKSTIHSIPDYFLINGEPYTDASPISIPGGLAGQSVMLRMLNASVNSHIPVLPGFHHLLVAEDGRPYKYPRTLCAPELPALKTMDSIVTPTAVGLYPLYDRSLGLVNGTSSAGGMLAYLGVGQTFVMPNITIPGAGNIPPFRGNPYPATINVGVPGKIGKVSVSFSLTHPRVHDVDMLLVSPSGTKVRLMSDVGGAIAFNGVITLDDDALTSLTSGPIVAGSTYKPTDLTPTETFPTAAAAPPYASTLSAFNGGNQDGIWSLFVIDDAAGPSGGVNGLISNFSLNIVPAK